MSEDELAEIEKWTQYWLRQGAVLTSVLNDTMSLIAEVRRLRAENERLERSIKDMAADLLGL